MHKSIQFLIIFIQILINTTTIFASQKSIPETKPTKISKKEKNESIIIYDETQNGYIKFTKDDWYDKIHPSGYPFLNHVIQMPINNKLAIIYPEIIREIRNNFLPSISFIKTQSDEDIKNLPEYTLFDMAAGSQLYQKVDTTKDASSMPLYIDIHIDNLQFHEIRKLISQNKFCAISTKDCNDSPINVKITEITDKLIISQFVIEESNEPCNSQFQATIYKRDQQNEYKLYITENKTTNKASFFNEAISQINLSQEDINTLQKNYDDKGNAKKSDNPCRLILKNPNGQHATFDINRILEFKFQKSESEAKPEAKINYFVIGAIMLAVAIPTFIYLMKIFLHRA
jgi:hypothetical protein